MNNFKSIIEYLKPFKASLLLNILFNLIAVVFSVFSLLMLIPFLRILFGIQSFAEQISPKFSLLPVSELKENLASYFNYYISNLINNGGQMKALFFICIVVVLIFLIKNISRYVALYFLSNAKKGVLANIRAQLYDKYLNLSLKQNTEQKRGTLMSYATNDLIEIEYGIIHFMESVVKEPLMILFTLIVMCSISVKLTIIVLLILPLSAAVIGWIGSRLKKSSHQSQNLIASISGLLEETMEGLKTIKLFSAEEFFKNKFIQLNEQHLKVSKQALRQRDMSSPMSEFLGIALVVVILYLGGKMVLVDKSIAPELFITYIVIFSQLISPLKAFSNAFGYIQKSAASLERIKAFMTLPEQSKGGKPFNSFSKQIAFENISFKYDKENMVLENCSFKILKGQHIAIVGKSGSGKTTLIDLLLKFYKPSSGQIIIDDQLVSDLGSSDIRKLIAVVDQDVFLFNENLHNNISMGSEYTLSEMETILEMAQMKEVYSQKGTSLLGNRGDTLSEGQKQRVALARALVREPSILILDEITSSLDSWTEKNIVDMLSKIKNKTTIISITHRKALAEAADKVFVLHKGKIIEQGSHEVLLDNNSLYSQLFLD